MIEVSALNTFCRMYDMVYKETGVNKQGQPVFIFLKNDGVLVRKTKEEILKSLKRDRK